MIDYEETYGDKFPDEEMLAIARKRRDIGVEVLDSEKPDWWKGTDLSYLDMGSPNRCVLGQNIGWDEGRDVLEGWGTTAVKAGFDSSMAMTEKVSYHALAIVWEELILERRKAEAEKKGY